MTLDPKTHRFGMAYIDHSSIDPVYPVAPSIHEGQWQCQYTNRGNPFVAWLHISVLVRCPEHDLIPKAEINDLIRTLEFYAIPDTSDMPNETGRDKLSRNAKLADHHINYIQDMGRKATKALAKAKAEQ